MSYPLENNFSYHSPSPENVVAMQDIRNTAKDLAYLISDRVPDCRERALAMTNLEQVVMWANAGIARNQDG